MAAGGLSTLVSTIVFVVSAQVLVDTNLLRCVPASTRLGCVIVSVLASLVVALLIAAVAGGIVLRLRGMPRAAPVALFGAAGVGASWLFVRSITDTAVAAWLAVVAFLLWGLAFHALFNLSLVFLPMGMA